MIYTATVRWTLLALFTACMAAGLARASDVQIKTADGETIQGEFLGTQDGVIKVRSKYGEVSIPAKDVITMIKAPDAAAPADSKKKKANADPESAPIKFPEPRDVNLIALLAARTPDPPVPTAVQRQEILRYIHNFRGSTDKYRTKAINVLQDFGEMAYPYFAGEYVTADDLDDKVQLLAAVAVPGSPYTAGIFAKTHAMAITEFNKASSDAPTQLPNFVTKKEREGANPQTAQLKAAAIRVLAIEADASVAQGPFNTLFLFQIYKARYSAEANALLNDPNRDRVLLGAAASDAGKSDSEWRGSDRVMFAEQAFPLLFQDNADLKSIAEELLKRVLPAAHPKFTASEEEWFNWWAKNKEKVEKK
jgi:hypothetical protein